MESSHKWRMTSVFPTWWFIGWLIVHTSFTFGESVGLVELWDACKCLQSAIWNKCNGKLLLWQNLWPEPLNRKRPSINAAACKRYDQPWELLVHDLNEILHNVELGVEREIIFYKEKLWKKFTKIQSCKIKGNVMSQIFFLKWKKIVTIWGNFLFWENFTTFQHNF
jgi:hypothetical protein